jgi:hypothetical protein
MISEMPVVPFLPVEGIQTGVTAEVARGVI